MSALKGKADIEAPGLEVSFDPERTSHISTGTPISDSVCGLIPAGGDGYVSTGWMGTNADRSSHAAR
jgi:hypothetical protein